MRSLTVSRKTRHIAAALPVLVLLSGGACLAAEPARAGADAARESADSAAREQTERELVAAQQSLEAAMRKVEQLSTQLGAHFGNRFFVGGPMVPPRAILGLQVDSRDGSGGAHVMAVSPGGPAEAAGIKSGDVITAIDGKDLAKSGDPGRALVDSMLAQEPDHKVKVRLQRDGKSRDVEVTTRAAPRMFAMAPGAPGMPGMPRRPGAPQNMRFQGPSGPAVPAPPGVMHFQLQRDGDRGPEGPDLRWERGSPLAGMELATLSERLGGYFGTKAGVLVVRAGSNDIYKLQDGDVIVAIDGREPNSASHATRILRSYQRGEKLQMKVLRERKSVTLEVTLPG